MTSTRRGVPERAVRLAQGLQGKTCLTWSRLHLLKGWSVFVIRGDSVRLLESVRKNGVEPLVTSDDRIVLVEVSTKSWELQAEASGLQVRLSLVARGDKRAWSHDLSPDSGMLRRTSYISIVRRGGRGPGTD